MQIENPYLLFLGDARDQLAAKTAAGIVDWRPGWCLGQLRLPGCGADLGIDDMTVAEAKAAGVRTMVIGVVNPGGTLPDQWVDVIVQALAAGLDVASGLHTRLAEFDRVREAAHAHQRQLFDVRHSDETFRVGNGVKRAGKRLLTVGTDCSVGKKYTALAIERDMRGRGFNAEFRATGQTGVLISGRGVAIDAVIADFIAGAAEWISPDNTHGHWDIVEGQGSLFHPSFAGVTLGLLHGSQPDAFVVCHEPTRQTMRNVMNPIPSIESVINATVELGRLTNPNIRCAGISVNTAALDEREARQEIERTAERLRLPACDPYRFDADPIIDEIERVFGRS